jgi:Transcription factor TFIIB repeat.
MDGRRSKSVAAALIYLAGLITGREVLQREVASFFNISEQSVARLSSSLVDVIRIARTKARVPVEIDIPKEMCREIEKFTQLSEKVVCV